MRKLFLVLPLLLVLGGGSWWLRATPPAQSLEGPTITWSVPQLEATLFPGISSTTVVTFRSDQNLSGVVVEATPSLNGIVTVTPSSFASVVANQTYQLTFTIKAPPEFIKRAFGGTIHIRNKDKPPKTYAQPLNVGLRTDWNTFKDSSSGISFSYPQSWSSRQYQDTYTLSSTPIPRHLEGDPGDEIQINILPRNGAPSLTEWLSSYFRGEIDFSSTPLGSYTNSFGISFTTLAHLPGLFSDSTGAYALRGDYVIEISVAPASRFEEVFSSVLASLFI